MPDAPSSSGKSTVSDSVNLGSNPSGASKTISSREMRDRLLSRLKEPCKHPNMIEVDTDEDNTGIPPYDQCYDCGFIQK